MKIGNGGSGEDLIQRMKQAHHSEVEQSSDASRASRKSGATGASGAKGADKAGEAELQNNLLETASAALDGEYASSDKLRGAVVETIVDTRYSDGLADEERTRVVETLQQTLVDDVEFRKEVDNMLILAARQLAHADSK